MIAEKEKREADTLLNAVKGRFNHLYTHVYYYIVFVFGNNATSIAINNTTRG